MKIKDINKANNFVRWILFPFIFLSIVGILTILHLINSSSSFTILEQDLNKDNFLDTNYQKILAGRSIVGRFTALENNMGIVELRFNSYDRINNDIVVFSIKEINTNKPIYINNYDSQQFLGLPLFPFGFPPIPDSKGKSYEFEIRSKKGSQLNSVSLSDKNPLGVIDYQFSKVELLNDSHKLINFTFKKVLNSILYNDLIFSIYVYSLPLFLYILWNLLQTKYTQLTLGKTFKFFHHKPATMYSLLLISSFFDILFIEKYNFFVIFLIAVLWIFIMKMVKLNKDFFYYLCILFIVIGSILELFNLAGNTEKAMIWAFIFLLIALVRSIIYELMTDKS